MFVSQLLFLGAVATGCGSDDDSEPSCEERFDADSAELTACKFVEKLDEVWGSTSDSHEIGSRMSSECDVFIGNSLYEQYFNTNYHTYEEVLYWFRNDVSNSVFNPKGAKFESVSISNKKDNTPGAIRPVRSATIDIKLDNGKGFSILTAVEIEKKWYILTLLRVF